MCNDYLFRYRGSEIFCKIQLLPVVMVSFGMILISVKGLEITPKSFAIASSNRIMVDACD